MRQKINGLRSALLDHEHHRHCQMKGCPLVEIAKPRRSSTPHEAAEPSVPLCRSFYPPFFGFEIKKPLRRSRRSRLSAANALS